jgi:hypothetical protein
MDLEARAMRGRHDIGERVERRIVGRIRERRLRRPRVERIAATADLNDEGVDVGPDGRIHEIIGLTRRADPLVKRIDPDGPEFRAILREERPREGQKENERKRWKSMHAAILAAAGLRRSGCFGYRRLGSILVWTGMTAHGAVDPSGRRSAAAEKADGVASQAGGREDHPEPGDREDTGCRRGDRCDEQVDDEEKPPMREDPHAFLRIGREGQSQRRDGRAVGRQGGRTGRVPVRKGVRGETLAEARPHIFGIESNG